MILLRREFEFLQKISCNCHNVHGSAISRNFLRHMNGAHVSYNMLQAEMLHISKKKKNVHTYVKCPFKIEFFLLPFLQKRLSIETFIIIATGYVHCISFEKSAKKSNDFRSTTLLRSSLFDVQKGFDFKKIQMTCTQRRKKVIVGKICKISWKFENEMRRGKKMAEVRSSLFYVLRTFPCMKELNTIRFQLWLIFLCLMKRNQFHTKRKSEICS